MTNQTLQPQVDVGDNQQGDATMAVPSVPTTDTAKSNTTDVVAGLPQPLQEKLQRYAVEEDISPLSAIIESLRGWFPKQKLWRIGEVTNPHTQKRNVVDLTRDGFLAPSDARRVGVDRADEWVEIRAPSSEGLK